MIAIIYELRIVRQAHYKSVRIYEYRLVKFCNDQKWEVTYRSYRIIEYSISTRQIGRITDLSLIIPFSDENSPSTGLITYFRFMDIAVDANDIWIVGHNTFNNSLLSTSSLDWVSNGLYRLNRGDMKYLGSILKKGFNKDQIIQPNFVTLRYRTVVNGGDKYADQ